MVLYHHIFVARDVVLCRNLRIGRVFEVLRVKRERRISIRDLDEDKVSGQGILDGRSWSARLEEFFVVSRDLKGTSVQGLPNCLLTAAGDQPKLSCPVHVH